VYVNSSSVILARTLRFYHAGTTRITRSDDGDPARVVVSYIPMRSDDLRPGDRVLFREGPDAPVLEGTVEHDGAYWDGVFSWPASLIRHDDGREDVYLQHMILGRAPSSGEAQRRAS
jgi:hypothetical protein